jgi:hypothetical protein
VRTPGAHGRLHPLRQKAHQARDAPRARPRAVTLLKLKISDNIRTTLEQAHGTMEKAMGTGAAVAVSAVTLNVSTVASAGQMRL